MSISTKIIDREKEVKEINKSITKGNGNIDIFSVTILIFNIVCLMAVGIYFCKDSDKLMIDMFLRALIVGWWGAMVVPHFYIIKYRKKCLNRTGLKLGFAAYFVMWGGIYLLFLLSFGIWVLVN